ncbi:MAG: ABC transporter permease [Eubacterium sp.]|nr:ABC transporter permease [Eubacterium sp.]
MKKWLNKQSETLSLAVVIVILVVVFSILNSNMLTIFNLKNVLVQASLTAIAAAGMTFAYTAGVFDMSVGSLLALTSVLLAKLVIAYNLGAAVAAGIALAVITGTINGLIVTKIKVQAFAATLVTMILIRGIAVLISDGTDVSLFAYSSVKFISSGTIFMIPFPIILTAAVYLISGFIYHFTTLGMKIRAIGSNMESARISGINTDLVIIQAFIMTSVTAVIASFINTAQVMFGKATIGENFPLDVMTIVILGGTSINGGYGNLKGSLVASLLVAIIKNGLNINNVNSYFQNLVIGIILISALVYNGVKEKRAAKNVRRGG